MVVLAAFVAIVPTVVVDVEFAEFDGGAEYSELANELSSMGEFGVCDDVFGDDDDEIVRSCVLMLLLSVVAAEKRFSSDTNRCS